MSSTARPPEFYCQGAGVFIPLRIADLLQRITDLHAVSTAARGQDAEFDAVANAIRLAAMAWRSSVSGTRVAEPAEQAAESDRWLSTGEAAVLLGVGPRAIRQAIARGRLPASKTGRLNRISREDLEQYRAARAA